MITIALAWLWAECASLDESWRGKTLSQAKNQEQRSLGTEHLRHSQLPPALHRFQHGDFVGVLDVAPYRNSHCDASYFQSRAPELA